MIKEKWKLMWVLVYICEGYFSLKSLLDQIVYYL